MKVKKITLIGAIVIIVLLAFYSLLAYLRSVLIVV